MIDYYATICFVTSGTGRDDIIVPDQPNTELASPKATEERELFPFPETKSSVEKIVEQQSSLEKVPEEKLSLDKVSEKAGSLISTNATPNQGEEAPLPGVEPDREEDLTERCQLLSQSRPSLLQYLYPMKTSAMKLFEQESNFLSENDEQVSML
jgi:hypothetical protein